MDSGDLRLVSFKFGLSGCNGVGADDRRQNFFSELPAKEAGQDEVGLQATGPAHRVLDGAEVDGLAVLRILRRPHGDLLSEFFGGHAAVLHFGLKPRSDAAATAQKLGFAFQDVQPLSGH